MKTSRNSKLSSRLPDLEQVRAEKARRSLREFARQAWPILEPQTPLKWGWAVDAICDHLEAVTRGDIRRLLMNVPPGTMKSLLTSVIWPAWEWIDNPHLRYLGTAHKQDLAVRDNTKCRRLIQSDWYQRHWPVVLTGDQNAKTKFENDKTGFREAMAFASMTGSRGDRVILDDPHSVDDANSRVKLASDVLTFREALPSRVNNEHSAIVIIMQRLAEGDVSDAALELGYEHLMIPMRYEGKSKCVVGPGDPRKEDGELMFPERFPEKAVRELEISLGSYGAAGQLQQRPSPRGGGVLKSSWFGRYKELPKMVARRIYADTAQKTAERNDYSVFECWGLGDNGKIYLIDLLRGKWEAHELETRAINFWEKHLEHDQWLSCPLSAMKVEDKSSGTGLVQNIRKRGRIPIVGIPRTKDKFSRACDAQGSLEAGLVCIPEVAPWVSDFCGEVDSFTKDDTHAFDDQIDPMLDAINDLLLSKRASIYDVL
ncbi:large terminase [Caudoviricetes sp.]|nr:large terminase [Caudoviricetes sp.]